MCQISNTPHRVPQAVTVNVDSEARTFTTKHGTVAKMPATYRGAYQRRTSSYARIIQLVTCRSQRNTH